MYYEKFHIQDRTPTLYHNPFKVDESQTFISRLSQSQG